MGAGDSKSGSKGKPAASRMDVDDGGEGADGDEQHAKKKEKKKKSKEKESDKDMDEKSVDAGYVEDGDDAEEPKEKQGVLACMHIYMCV